MPQHGHPAPDFLGPLLGAVAGGPPMGLCASARLPRVEEYATSKPRCSVVLILLVTASSMAASGGAQTGFGVPRFADGRPDLQGVWDFRAPTPIERPEVSSWA